MKSLFHPLFCLLFLLLPPAQAAASTAVWADQNPHPASEAVAFHLRGMSGAADDWIGIYPAGATNAWDNVVAWRWTAGIVDGDVVIGALPVGDYEARAFFNNSFDTEAIFPFQVAQTNISLTKQVYPTGEAIKAWVETMLGNAEDWVGVYPVGASNAWSNVVAWDWTHGIVDGEISLPSNGSILPPGDYEVRAFFRNSFVMEASATFSISTNPPATSITTSRPAYHSGDLVRLHVDNMIGKDDDWVGIYPAGVSNEWDNVIAWRWGGIVNGDIDIGVLPAGEYEARAFFNNSFDTEAETRFTVLAPERISQGPGAYAEQDKAGISTHDFAVTMLGQPRSVRAYFPNNLNTDHPLPAILFAPGGLDNDASYANYDALLNFIASKGYITYYVAHHYAEGHIPRQIIEGFTSALQQSGAYVDTTRIGLVGFSSGAGSLMSIGYRLFGTDGLGANGRFIFSLSPGMDYGIDEFMGGDGSAALENYPGNTWLLMQIYDHDLTVEDPNNPFINENVNDPRNLVDLYRHIGIDNTRKEFMILKTRWANYPANHMIPKSGEGELTPLDYYAIFKPLEKLAGAALGNNVGAFDGLDAAGGFVEVHHSDDPEALFNTTFEQPAKPTDQYPFSCDRAINARRAYCADAFQ